MYKNSGTWALILGGSGGFGLASAKYLAEKGMNIFVVHRDTRNAMASISVEFDKILKAGVNFHSININANNSDNADKIINKLINVMAPHESLKLFIHSISDGNIKPFVKNGTNRFNLLTDDDFQHTINAMGLSFVFWSRILLEKKILKKNSRIIGFTSEGSLKVLPGYTAISAAKGVVEAFCRNLAVELAPYQITVNLINAGITDTKALRAFPDHALLLKNALRRNPSGRLTQPEDIAKVVYLLTLDEAEWITGDIIRVDGGEQLIGFL